MDVDRVAGCGRGSGRLGQAFIQVLGELGGECKPSASP